MARVTVGQLIEQLSKLDPGMRVFVDGYEGGLDDPYVVTEMTSDRASDKRVPLRARRKAANPYYMGDYEEHPSGRIKAVVLSRDRPRDRR